MKVYHKVNSNSVGAVLSQGLKRSSRGVKGDDARIIQTDAFLDERRPQRLIDMGVSRDDNVYGYVSVDSAIVDITDGSLVPINDFIRKSTEKVLELNVDENRCFVSDLDTYDALRVAISERKSNAILDRLAHSYWSKITNLADFKPNDMRRPEVMIPFDISPTAIHLIEGGRT